MKEVLIVTAIHKFLVLCLFYPVEGESQKARNKLFKCQKNDVVNFHNITRNLPAIIAGHHQIQ